MKRTETAERSIFGKINIRQMSMTAIMSVLLAICSWVSIPAPVPFTLQTFGVFIALKLLGGSYGTMAILVYILLGAVGIPVFAGFSGGVSVLAGPTGGYILGFLLTGLFYKLAERKLKNRYLEDAVLFLGLLVCYFFGTLRFVSVMGSRGSAVSWGQALMLCVVPYLVPDVLKLVLADLIAARVRPMLRKLYL